jgi:hypothetical protein
VEVPRAAEGRVLRVLLNADLGEAVGYLADPGPAPPVAEPTGIRFPGRLAAAAPEPPPEDHWQIRDPEIEIKLLDAYYEFKGWTNDGIPTQETLDKLGLDYVSEDFLQRGILTDKEGTPSKETAAQKEKK